MLNVVGSASRTACLAAGPCSAQAARWPGCRRCRRCRARPNTRESNGMKKRWLLQAVVVAASLFVMNLASPSTAEASCDSLGRALIGVWAGLENPAKPTNVAGGSGTSNVFYVSWNIPSTRPVGTASGRCVHLQHIATGVSREWCKDETDATDASISIWNCLRTNYCPTGDYNIKVKLKNVCGYTEFWSDSVGSSPVDAG